MATTHSPDDGSADVCPDCDDRTSHEVRIDIVAESSSDDEDAAKFSREPYRVTECLRCGREQYRRMNDA